MNKVFLIIFCFFFMYSCSYEPILTNKKYNFQFENIRHSGEENINGIIKNNLYQRSAGIKKYEIIFDTEKKREILSSNEKGDPTIFRLNINLNYLVNFDGVEVLKNSIKKEITYNNIDDKFELFKYEENILESLADNLTDDILISIVSLN